MKKLEKTRVVTNIERYMYHRFARSAENFAIVSESVAEDPNVSIPRRSQELRPSYTTLWRILHLDLHLYPYIVQLTQQLKLTDHSQRRRYIEWMLEKYFIRILFTFTFEGTKWLTRYIRRRGNRMKLALNMAYSDVGGE